MLRRLPDEHRNELREALNLRHHEISQRLFAPFHDSGLISQFEGYEQLLELDWEAYQRQHGDIPRLDRILEAEGDTPNRYKASEQADALMLFYLLSPEELLCGLRYSMPSDTIPKNIEYYLRRTSHGSTRTARPNWGRPDRPSATAHSRSPSRSPVAPSRCGPLPGRSAGPSSAHAAAGPTGSDLAKQPASRWSTQAGARIPPPRHDPRNRGPESGVKISQPRPPPTG